MWIMTQSEATNLVILCTDRSEFSAWRRALTPYEAGKCKWVELPSFGRILLVFESEPQAQAALDYIRAEHPEANAFYGPSMPLESKPTYLALPDAGRLWFISPPPSPPSGWESSAEEAPNTRTHFELEFNQQLQQALLSYQAQLSGQNDGSVWVLHPGDEQVPKLQVEFSEGEGGKGGIPRTAMPGGGGQG